MGIIVGLILNILAFYVVAYLVPGVVVSGWEALIVVSIVWGILSVLLRPILILLTLPINILTLGLFSLVINAGLILLTGAIVQGFVVTGFGSALLAAVILALVNMLLSKLK